MPFHVIAVLVALGVAAWLGYQAIQGLRTGDARAAGFRFSRKDRPGEFWLVLAVQLLVILVLLMVVVLEIMSVP